MSYDPPGHMDPYSEAYTAPEEAPNVSAAQNDNSARRSRSPDRRSDRGGYRRRSPPAARRPTQATSVRVVKQTFFLSRATEMYYLTGPNSHECFRRFRSFYPLHRSRPSNAFSVIRTY